MKDDEKDFSFSGTVKIISAKALCVDAGPGDDQWIPKSQINEECGNSWSVGDEVELIIPVWLAKKKGLVQDEVAATKPDDIPF